MSEPPKSSAPLDQPSVHQTESARQAEAHVPRLFVDVPLAEGAVVALPPEATHYLLGVMRLRSGDPVLLIDDRSGEWRARIAGETKRDASARIEHQTRPRETVPDFWLCAAPLKRGRIDWMAEKACELGVARFVPVVTERTVVRRVNQDRLRAHMIEAAEQCGRTALPSLAEATPLERLLDGWDGGRRLIFCDEEGGLPLTRVLQEHGPGPAAILVGPEGGFTPGERLRIGLLPASVPVSLGPRVLRADTAAVAATALWQALSGDWSG